jgi:DNA polymerase III subunit alpha
VRYALAAIKGVGKAAMDQLVQERQGQGRFCSVFDLMARCGTRVINKRLLESLARAGAMDSLEANRRRLVEGADLLLRYATAAGEAADSSQVSLFGGSGAAQVPVPDLPTVDDWPALERLQMEFDVLGLYLSAHPLDGYGAALTRLGVIPGDRLRQVAAAGENGRLKLAGVAVAKQERVTERTRFARVILSDPSAQFEVTVFSELLAQQRELLDGSAPLYLEVDARIDGDNLRLTVQRLQPLDEVADQNQPTVEIRLATPAVALKLKPILERRGQSGARVRLVVPVPEGEEAILVLPDQFLLGTGQRLNVEGLPGVLGVRDLTRLH